MVTEQTAQAHRAHAPQAIPTVLEPAVGSPRALAGPHGCSESLPQPLPSSCTPTDLSTPSVHSLSLPTEHKLMTLGAWLPNPPLYS